jgi:YihY family inner membrane protein
MTDIAFAAIVYGWYAGLVYFTPLIGGWVADRILGTKRTVLIGVLLSFVPQIPRDALGNSGVWHDATLFVRSWIGPLASLVSSILVMLIAYKFLPKPRPAFRYALVGAVIAGILFEIARRVFTIYVEKIARYDIVYGALGSIIAFLFFVYIAAMILLYGAELGASIRRVQNAGRLLPRKKAKPETA